MEVYTVGQNAYGELAHCDNIERHVFTLVESCKNMLVTQVCAGNEHSLILTEKGDVYSSGYNEMGGGGGNTTTNVGTTQFTNSNTNSGIQNQSNNSNKTGQLKIIGELRGKNVIKIFAANGCEHVIALTSNIYILLYYYKYR